MKRLALIAVMAATCAMATTTAAPARTNLGCYVNLWVSGKTYTGRVVRSYHTSCPFAKRVTAASLRFIVTHGGSGDGDFYVRAYSPVTFRWYRMHCFADGDIYGSGIHVDCRGGIGARVVYNAINND